ncbi:hypothetical protein TNCV_2909341 [Trichonephila clavipes]|nr:hypothetical protein TNCV_2909341 [Trichonephila clavipes]
MPPDRQCQMEGHEINRGKGLDVRMSLDLASSTVQVSVRFNLRKFLKEGNERCQCARASVRQVGLFYERWRHHRSPPPQFRHGTGREGNILQPLHLWFQL